MRPLHVFVIAATLLGLVACGSGITLPPVSPQDVEVIPEGQDPPEDFEEIKRINRRVAWETPRDSLIAQAREIAAELGADALRILSISPWANISNPQLVLKGMAIYYPSRHPELEGN
jgi:hypothetical protein